MPSINHSKAWDRLSTLTSFVSRICFSKAQRSDSDSVNECIVIPPNSDFTRVMVGIVKKIMSTYLYTTSPRSFMAIASHSAQHVHQSDDGKRAHDMPVLFDQTLVGREGTRNLLNQLLVKHVRNSGRCCYSRSGAAHAW